MLMSLKLKENSATSDPETTKDKMRSPSINMPRIVVLFRLISSKMNANKG
jgi:hypothetical protein